jgi:hypothetical protein
MSVVLKGMHESLERFRFPGQKHFLCMTIRFKRPHVTLKCVNLVDKSLCEVKLLASVIPIRPYYGEILQAILSPVSPAATSPATDFSATQ